MINSFQVSLWCVRDGLICFPQSDHCFLINQKSPLLVMNVPLPTLCGDGLAVDPPCPPPLLTPRPMTTTTTILQIHTHAHTHTSDHPLLPTHPRQGGKASNVRDRFTLRRPRSPGKTLCAYRAPPIQLASTRHGVHASTPCFGFNLVVVEDLSCVHVIVRGQAAYL